MDVVPSQDGVVVVDQDVQVPALVRLVQRVGVLPCCHGSQELVTEDAELGTEELSVPEGHSAGEEDHHVPNVLNIRRELVVGDSIEEGEDVGETASMAKMVNDCCKIVDSAIEALARARERCNVFRLEDSVLLVRNFKVILHLIDSNVVVLLGIGGERSNTGCLLLKLKVELLFEPPCHLDSIFSLCAFWVRVAARDVHHRDWIAFTVLSVGVLFDER